MLVAELHDVAKLLDRSELNQDLARQGLGQIKRQSFEGVQFDPNQLPEPRSDTWKALIKHEGDKSWETLQGLSANADPEEVEARRQRFIVTLADRFASSISREPRASDQEFLVVRKLWGTETQDRTVKDLAGFRDLLAFLNSDPSREKFFERYGDALHSVPEDRRTPFTSLHNHLRLAGKIARQLDAEINVDQRNGRWTASFRGEDLDSVDEAHGSTKRDIVGKWKFVLVKLYVRFPHFIVRLQDLNILGQRLRSLRLLAERHPDNVLYFTEDFALLFFPDLKPDIVQQFSQFQWCFRTIESDLTTMSSNLDASGRFRSPNARKHGAQIRESRWPATIKEVINGPLCPVCQLEPATEKWVKGALEEKLCQKCLERRATAPAADEYARWDELGVDVAWLRLAVWPDAARDLITNLFAQAVNNDPETLDDFRSLPLEMDFLDDCEKIQKGWREGLSQSVPVEQLIQPVSDYPDLLILRLDQPNLWLAAIKIFSNALAEHAPKLVDHLGTLCSPLQLFVDISSTKFAFHEHWRYLSNPGEAAINIRDVRKSIDLSFSVDNFQRLCEFTQSLEFRRPLHELSELFEATNSRGAVLLSAWERRVALEQRLHGTGADVVGLVQLARLVNG